MGMNWTAFGGGFAKAAVESFDKEEEDAKARAALQVKGLYENYANVVKENRTISNDVKEKINVIKGFAPDASPDQLVALAQDRGILDMLYTKMRDKDFDATGFNINNFVTAAKSDSPLSAEDRINKLFTIPDAVNKASAAFKSIAPEPAEEEGFLSGMMKKAGLRGAKSGREQAAAAYGVPIEQLQAAKEYTRTTTPSGAQYNLAALKVLPKPQEEWASKVATLKLKQAAGNPTEKEQATKELDSIYEEERRASQAKQTSVERRNNLIAEKEMLASEGDKEAIAWLVNEAAIQGEKSKGKQTPVEQRNNRLAALQTTITTSNDSQEVKRARTQLDKELALIALEARSKYIEPKKDGESKIPSLGALNTFVGTSVAQAVLNAHGSLKDDMAIITRTGEGGATYQDFDYIGDDPAKRKQVEETKQKAAKAALSVFMDNEGKPLDRNVRAVLNSWTGSDIVPSGAGRGGLGGRPAPAPAAPSPAAPTAASNTIVTGTGDTTKITVIDPSGGSHVFKGADASKRATAFKSAAGIK